MGVVAGRAAILEDEGLEEGAQRDEDDDEERQHHADLVKMGIAGQAEQRVQDELHGAGEDQADDQEQDRALEQMADKRDRAEGQRRDRPYRVDRKSTRLNSSN